MNECKIFDELVVRRRGASISLPRIEGDEDSENCEYEFKEYKDGNEEARNFPIYMTRLMQKHV